MGTTPAQAQSTGWYPSLIEKNVDWYTNRFLDPTTRQMFWSKSVWEVERASNAVELSQTTLRRAQRCPFQDVQDKLRALQGVGEQVDLRPFLAAASGSHSSAKHSREETGENPAPPKRHQPEQGPVFVANEDVVVVGNNIDVWTVASSEWREDGWVYMLVRKVSRQVEHSSMLMHGTRRKIEPKEESLRVGDRVLYLKDAMEHLAEILHIHKTLTPYCFDIRLIKLAVEEHRLSKFTE